MLVSLVVLAHLHIADADVVVQRALVAQVVQRYVHRHGLLEIRQRRRIVRALEVDPGDVVEGTDLPAVQLFRGQGIQRRIEHAQGVVQPDHAFVKVVQVGIERADLQLKVHAGKDERGVGGLVVRLLIDHELRPLESGQGIGHFPGSLVGVAQDHQRTNLLPPRGKLPQLLLGL